MSRIVGEPLIPSLPNAPLDARTEVDSLSDIPKIENPSESLIIYVRQTKKHYKIVSFKNVSIPGTLKTRKVIDKYEPFGNSGSEEVFIGGAEPTDEGAKLWVDTSVSGDEGGDTGGGSDGGNDGDGSGGGSDTKQYETLNLVVATDNDKAITAVVNVNGKDIEVSSASGYSEKFEYGTEYTITPYALEGYSVPEAMTFTAGQEIRTVTLNYAFAGPYITTIRIDQTISDPDMMVYRIVDDGGIEKIRANSHRYLGKNTADGEMTICRLDDNDGTKYHDGTIADIKGGGGDVFMKLPKFYWKCEAHATNIFDFSVAYGAKPNETWNEWDGKELIGVYKASKDDNEQLRSISGKDAFIGYPSVLSPDKTSYVPVQWNHHCMMAMLFYTYYESTNALEICGEPAEMPVSGKSDNLGMSDTTPEINGNNSFVNFWGLENWWVTGKEEYIGNAVVNPVTNNGTLRITESDGSYRDINLTDFGDYGYFVLKMALGQNIDMVPTDSGASAAVGYCSQFVYQYIANYSDSVYRYVYRGRRGIASFYCSRSMSTSFYTRLCFNGNVKEETDVELFKELPLNYGEE